MKVLEGLTEASRAEYIRQGGSQAEYDRAVSQIAERLLRLEVGFWDMAFGEICCSFGLLHRYSPIVGTSTVDLGEQPWEVNCK